MADANADPRPLSPHLGIWKFTPTLAASITHRGTGMFLYSGSLLLTAWLGSAAIGPEAFATVQALYGSPPGLVVLAGYTWALMFHLLNGLRHLVWDTGRGLAPATAQGTALGVYALATVLTAAVWIVGHVMKGAA